MRSNVRAVPDALRTARLRLDPWAGADFGLFAGLARTPAVMRYIGNGTTWTDARIHDVAARIASHWTTHGFGWRVGRLHDGSPVGLFALNFAGEGAGIDPAEYEIGWWLSPSAWGRGLAREGAAAVRDEAFARLAAPSIVARIQPGNAASLRVAAAIGLRHESESTGRDGESIAVLRLNAPDRRLGVSAGPGLPPAARPGAPA